MKATETKPTRHAKTGAQSGATAGRKSTAKSTVVGKPFTPNDPRSGRGPAKGAPNAGRPPKRFTEFVQEIREETPGFREAIKRAAENEESRAFPHVLKLVREYDPDAPHTKGQKNGATTLTLVIRHTAPMENTADESIGSLAWNVQ